MFFLSTLISTFFSISRVTVVNQGRKAQKDQAVKRYHSTSFTYFVLVRGGRYSYPRRTVYMEASHAARLTC